MKKSYFDRWGVKNRRKPKGFIKQRKARRRKEAEERQAKYDALSIQEKIELVQSRRGKSKKQLARLMELLG